MKTISTLALAVSVFASTGSYAGSPCAGTYSVGFTDGEYPSFKMYVKDGDKTAWLDHYNRHLGSDHREHGNFEVVDFQCDPQAPFILEFEVNLWARFMKFFPAIPPTPPGTECWDQGGSFECPPSPGLPDRWIQVMEERPFVCHLNRTHARCEPKNVGDEPRQLDLSVQFQAQ